MTHRRLLTIGLSAVTIAAIGLVSPSAWRAGSLYWAKSSARRIFAKFTPEERQNLNAKPILVEFPSVELESRLLETVSVGGYVAQVPRATSSDHRSSLIHLVYPRYEVILRPPSSIAMADVVARQLQFRDTFDQRSAVYRSQLSDLDSQHDLASLRRFLLLISLKPGRTFCQEQFTTGDIRGFILAPIPGETRTVAEVFIPSSHAACGVWFIDRDGLTQSDIHQFLASLRIKPDLPTNKNDRRE